MQTFDCVIVRTFPKSFVQILYTFLPSVFQVMMCQNILVQLGNRNLQEEVTCCNQELTFLYIQQLFVGSHTNNI